MKEKRDIDLYLSVTEDSDDILKVITNNTNNVKELIRIFSDDKK